MYSMLVLLMCDASVVLMQGSEAARSSACTPLLLGTWNNGCGRAQVHRATSLLSIAALPQLIPGASQVMPRAAGLPRNLAACCGVSGEDQRCPQAILRDRRARNQRLAMRRRSQSDEGLSPEARAAAGRLKLALDHLKKIDPSARQLHVKATLLVKLHRRPSAQSAACDVECSKSHGALSHAARATLTRFESLHAGESSGGRTAAQTAAAEDDSAIDKHARSGARQAHQQTAAAAARAADEANAAEVRARPPRQKVGKDRQAWMDGLCGASEGACVALDEAAQLLAQQNTAAGGRASDLSLGGPHLGRVLPASVVAALDPPRQAVQDQVCSCVLLPSPALLRSGLITDSDPGIQGT